MKAEPVKLLFSLAIALLLGFVCEIIAPEVESRNWISLAVGFVSIASVMVPAMGLNYKNVKRGVSIKVFAWIMVVTVTIANIVFSCFEYEVDIYIVIVLLLAIIGWSIIYGMYRTAYLSEK